MIRGSGTYYDGESAARRDVTVHVDPDGLRIVEIADSRDIGLWRFGELVAVDEVAREDVCRIRLGTGHTRLNLTDQALIAEVAARAPQLTSRDRGWAGLGLRWAAVFGVSMAVLVAALWLGIPRFADTVARLVPVEWEIGLGESLVEPLLRQLALLDGTPTAGYCTDRRGREAAGGALAAPRSRRVSIPLSSARREPGDAERIRSSGGPDRAHPRTPPLRQVTGRGGGSARPRDGACHSSPSDRRGPGSARSRLPVWRDDRRSRTRRNRVGPERP